jgi:hypothetical protein
MKLEKDKRMQSGIYYNPRGKGDALLLWSTHGAKEVIITSILLGISGGSE